MEIPRRHLREATENKVVRRREERCSELGQKERVKRALKYGVKAHMAPVKHILGSKQDILTRTLETHKRDRL